MAHVTNYSRIRVDIDHIKAILDEIQRRLLLSNDEQIKNYAHRIQILKRRLIEAEFELLTEFPQLAKNDMESLFSDAREYAYDLSNIVLDTYAEQTTKEMVGDIFEEIVNLWFEIKEKVKNL